MPTFDAKAVNIKAVNAKSNKVCCALQGGTATVKSGELTLYGLANALYHDPQFGSGYNPYIAVGSAADGSDAVEWDKTRSITLYNYIKIAPCVTVSVYNDVNDASPASTVDMAKGDKLSAPASPSKTGYDFSGWYTDKSLQNKWTPDSAVNADMSLYPKFTAKTYTITYNANGGSGAPANQTKTYGVELTLSSTKPTRTGYSFIRWNTAKDGTGKPYAAGAKYTANDKATLYAQWTPYTYAVKFDANGG